MCSSRRGGGLTLPAVAATMALLSILASRPTRAAPDRGLATALAWLDEDAPLVFAGRPGRLNKLATALGLAPGDRALAGLDLTRIDTWRELGLDPTRPAAGSVGAIDGPAATVLFEKLAAARTWNDQLFRDLTKTYWRSRLVLPVADRDAVRRAANRIAKGTEGLYSVADDEARSVGMVFGAHPKRAAEAVSTLGRLGVLVVGWAPDNRALIAITLARDGRVVVVDAVRPFAGIPVVWERNRRELDDLLGRARGDGRLARILDPAPAGDLQVWLRPAPALASVRALAQRQVLFALAAAYRDPALRNKLARQGRRDTAACAAFKSLAGRGALRQLALSASARDGALELRARGPRREVKAGFGLTDDGLWPLVATAPSAVVVYTASAAGARRAPRASLLRDFTAGATAAKSCGAGSTLAGLAFGGLGLLGLALDTALADPPFDGTARQTRNVAWMEAEGGAATIVSLARRHGKRARNAARGRPGARTFELEKAHAVAAGDNAVVDALAPADRATTQPQATARTLARFRFAGPRWLPSWLGELLAPLGDRVGQVEGSITLGRVLEGRLRLDLVR